MLLEVREVSRKTPRDGRLEVTGDTARRLAVFGATLPVEVDVQRGEVTLEVMACQCEKGGGAAGHTHHFVSSALFTSLLAGETVVLELLDGPLLAVARPHPLRPEP
ncbi:MAG: hypothetical protein IPP20_14785 [Gemmatimonadetes bacterium]|jgi:hypothetical protein|nr:hypothetical protein [Gemmatimonadota bacterium]